MKTIYQCEICGLRFYNEKEAYECENRGVAEELPKGLIMPYNLHEKDKVYLAIAGNKPQGHHRNYVYWACRDNGVGDSLGKEKCGGEFLTLESVQRKDKVNINSETFLRLFKWLKSQGIKPSVVNMDGDIVEI